MFELLVVRVPLNELVRDWRWELRLVGRIDEIGRLDLARRALLPLSWLHDRKGSDRWRRTSEHSHTMHKMEEALLEDGNRRVPDPDPVDRVAVVDLRHCCKGTRVDIVWREAARGSPRGTQLLRHLDPLGDGRK